MLQRNIKHKDHIKQNNSPTWTDWRLPPASVRCSWRAWIPPSRGSPPRWVRCLALTSPLVGTVASGCQAASVCLRIPCRLGSSWWRCPSCDRCLPVNQSTGVSKVFISANSNNFIWWNSQDFCICSGNLHFLFCSSQDFSIILHKQF